MPRTKAAPPQDDLDDDTGQRTVTHRPAGQWPSSTPPAGASSVFAAAQAHKPAPKPRLWLDLAQVEVKKGEPIPAQSRGPNAVSVYQQLLEKMQPGDSVQMSLKHAGSLVLRAKKLGIGVVKRRTGPDQVSIWKQ